MVKAYTETPVIDYFHLESSEGHQLYIETCGNPKGQAIVFLHGGPGGSISAKSRHFFNPEKYFIILFDQRGCGQSTPFLSLKNNTPQASVADMELIRQHFNLESWMVFGGSYGSTLALWYAIAHPKRVKHLILRGIFLGRQEDIDWLYHGGAGQFYPQEFEVFQAAVGADKADKLVNDYYHQMIQTDSNIESFRNLAKAWSDWESGLVTLVPQFNQSQDVSSGDLSIALLEAHYFANHMFTEDDNYILNHAQALAEIPIDIVHGRYDVDCRLVGAYQLAQACPKAKLHIIEKGAHSPYEPAMFNKLVEILDQI
ncbi:prolyl aminopeptidase [Eremococcus coleocola]|uniref:Proline iminopeptidase n=1 Tax=Eremococcus coleocola ACS-139-V-Col8 TaxID=908337 RepID=E4KLS2_9LACT|nr:prolyl aminopeptidase [Eremococcus coleocola]EFR31969.1 prolyl aminopeptidase [Eremococcus coleocola ACS-139-V-Col8]